ncbi:hypothetical protein niasHT_004555 [Heterodera trifolii]|uniref:EGF-like domain-containing protein n=1 Tax=Heterodera trifolii TaxID=157864 RepID=A0ABD2M3B4_9BILA
MMMKMMAFPSSFLQMIIFHLIIPLALLLFFFQTSSGANPCQDYSLHDCDAVAECDSEQPGFFQCKCPRGYVDVSPDRRRMPGRKCKRASLTLGIGLNLQRRLNHHQNMLNLGQRICC